MEKVRIVHGSLRSTQIVTKHGTADVDSSGHAVVSQEMATALGVAGWSVVKEAAPAPTISTLPQPVADPPPSAAPVVKPDPEDDDETEDTAMKLMHRAAKSVAKALHPKPGFKSKSKR